MCFQKKHPANKEERELGGGEARGGNQLLKTIRLQVFEGKDYHAQHCIPGLSPVHGTWQVLSTTEWMDGWMDEMK